jgi:hypothetical protein
MSLGRRNTWRRQEKPAGPRTGGFIIRVAEDSRKSETATISRYRGLIDRQLPPKNERPQEGGYQRGTNPKLEAVCRSTIDDSIF